MSKEAMKLALEALEYLMTNKTIHYTYRNKAEEAITACKQVLAAPVQEPVACVACEGNPKGENIPCVICGTTPSAVGLTDEEVYSLANEHLHYQMEGYEVSGIYNLARAIEVKLKEKNT